MEAADLQISGTQLTINESKKTVGGSNHIDALNDCKGVVYSYLSSKSSADAANTAFWILSACKVNKVCPLNFKQPPLEVIKACSNVAAPRSMLRKGGVMTNIYELCDVDLKDFSCQEAFEQQEGCLLRSFPAGVVFDNSTGYSFTSDLTNNIAAPWPSSSSMSLPALPTSQTLKNPGCRGCALEVLVPIFSTFVFGALLY
ncbi:hypothetical protein LWI28_021414 [Acer negundo]|uniref:Uncharacterized protein n=1 Tax=Acer negundo TaxID=4023 RepID=A0AAD5P3K3_ACENE|nr:hypothetical protein LWI28_021414 [Acer negundo]